MSGVHADPIESGAAQPSDLVVLNWPDDAAEVARLGALGVPRLLLVQPDGDPPPAPGPLLDWVRVPADEREVASRAIALVRRADTERDDVPVVDAHGRLLFAGAWVGLSPIEARLALALCERYTEVVEDERLLARAWPDHGDTGRRTAALRVHLTRLRQRIAPLGLEIKALRSHGMILQPKPSGTGSTH